jgi:hypothetical protein
LDEHFAVRRCSFRLLLPASHKKCWDSTRKAGSGIPGMRPSVRAQAREVGWCPVGEVALLRRQGRYRSRCAWVSGVLPAKSTERPSTRNLRHQKAKVLLSGRPARQARRCQQDYVELRARKCPR